MPTSIHLPKPLLEAVDRQARRLKISRNRFIVQTLETELGHQTRWSPGFFEKLTQVSPEDAKEVERMLGDIRSTRTRRKAPRL